MRWSKTSGRASFRKKRSVRPSESIATMVTWQELVVEATEELANAGVPDPEISAGYIAQRATGTDGADWQLITAEAATTRHLAAFDAMLARRRTGEPLQYVIGRWAFRTLDLYLDRRVLIPRPETEIVAESALDEIRRLSEQRGGETDVVVVDLGTGSGAIGLALATEHELSAVWLTDVSADALAVARANLAGTGRAGARVRVAEGPWFEALPVHLKGRVDVVVSNPPYVGRDDEVDPQVAWEPPAALFAADTNADVPATEHIEHLIDNAPGWLMDDGSLVVEMAPAQVGTMVERAGRRFARVERIKDLTGRWRGIVARSPVRS